MRKLIDDLMNLADRVDSAASNPFHVGGLYGRMCDIEQAAFYQAVAEHFDAVGSTIACQQNAAIARYLTDKGKGYVKNLAEHIRLIEEENA